MIILINHLIIHYVTQRLKFRLTGSVNPCVDDSHIHPLIKRPNISPSFFFESFNYSSGIWLKNWADQ